MPRSNQPHVPPHPRSYGRHRATREPAERILIVTEGKKTEPNYLDEIKQYYRLSATSWVVKYSDAGTCPLKVVGYAETLFTKGSKEGRVPAKRFDVVYAVFDRDQHEHYNAALQKAVKLDKTLKNDNREMIRFIAVPSVPDFELWLLLHFQDCFDFTDRHDVIKKLKEHIPDYEKGEKGYFGRTRDQMQTAMRRSAFLKMQRGHTSQGDVPYTDIDQLIKHLTKNANA